jgi:catechol 2,3-dioxygenase-like lactoylglutathione lyase family enzyme
MTLRRIDHIGLVVNDLAAAVAFFQDFGLIVQGTAAMQGDLLDNLLRLDGAKTEFAMLQTPDGGSSIEIIKFLIPDDGGAMDQRPVHALGLRHIAFEVDDLDAVVAKLKAKGMDVFSEIQNYENVYKLCYCRGPEGIILDLAEKIG